MGKRASQRTDKYTDTHEYTGRPNFHIDEHTNSYKHAHGSNCFANADTHADSNQYADWTNLHS
jgi:hypothetical protein